jgi:predicted secreted Zn-dependent protease
VRSPAGALCAILAAACYRAPTVDVGPIPAGVTVDAKLRYYAISAASVAEINRAIGRLGPRDRGRTWGATTTWRLDWTYQTARAGLAGCEARRALVHVRTETIFPRWTPTTEPDSALLVWWQQFSAGLAEHERGHAVLAVQAAGVLANEIDGQQAICGQLGGQVNAIAQKRILAVTREQEMYDFTTRHGATQIRAARQLQEP